MSTIHPYEMQFISNEEKVTIQKHKPIKDVGMIKIINHASIYTQNDK